MSDANCGDLPKPFATHEGEKVTVRSDVGMTPTACPSTSTMCRKIDQQIRGHISVIRTCGVEEKYLMADKAKANALDEYNTVLQEYATEVYNCRTEGCNGSPNLKISFLALLTVLAALIHWKEKLYLY